jgi:hypothetical protein
MSCQPTGMRRAAGLAMILWARDGPQEPQPEFSSSRPVLAATIVSNPVTVPASAAPGVRSAVGPVVYRSPPPDSAPGGDSATLANPWDRLRIGRAPVKGAVWCSVVAKHRSTA